MMITASILAAIFGLIALLFMRKFLLGRLNWLETVIFIFSVFITAVAIGFIDAGSWSVFFS